MQSQEIGKILQSELFVIDKSQDEVKSRHTVTCGSNNQRIQATARCESASSGEISGK